MSKLRLVDVFDHYGLVPAKTHGLDTWYCCPLHGEKTASLSVNNDEGKWYCFGCKKGGGRVEFVSQVQNISREEATQVLAVLDGEPVPELDEGRQLLGKIVDYMKIQTPTNPGAVYLESRGLQLSTVQKYGIGYCDDYDSLLDVFKVSRERAAELGLYDFSQSVIYPTYDFLGPYKISSRKISEKAYMQAQGKYHKFGLWGLDKIRSKELHIFEGFHDAMAGAQNGFPSVAMCGTNFYEEFWDEITERGVETVYVCTDGDVAGRECLEKVLGSYPISLDVRFVHLETGDPDDHIFKGLYESLVSRAELPLQWYVNHMLRPLGKELPELMSIYRKISPHYQRLERFAQESFAIWFSGKYGDTGIDYLYHNVEPNLKYERIVLGNALYSETARFETLQKLTEDCFHTKLHKNVFIRLRDDGVSSVMIEADTGVDLSRDVDLMNFKKYIEVVYDVGLRERVDSLLGRFRSTLKKSSDVGELVERLYTITDSESKVHGGGDVAKRVIKAIGERVDNPDVAGIPISPAFPTVNKSLLGWMPNKLILLSGNTGHGKTTVACNWIDDLIHEQDTQVLFASLEMTPEEIIEKQISIRTGIPAYKSITGSLEQSEYDRIVEASRVFLKDKLRIVYGVYDLYKLISIIKSQILRRKVRVVFIDYVQLIQLSSGRNVDTRWQDLMEITKAIKTQICSMGVTVVAISQLSKSSLNNDVPEAADQAGSYGMLADADVAIAVKKIPPEKIKDGANFIMHIDKHRYGTDNVLVPCVFNRMAQQIREVGA